jgi:antitoxin HigA-1
MSGHDESKAHELVATLPPLHPGEVLREEFMKPHGLTAYAVAKACGVPRTRLERIAREELGISGDSAVRLGRLFGIDARFWTNLQSRYEIERAELAAGRTLDEIKPIAA